VHFLAVLNGFGDIDHDKIQAQVSEINENWDVKFSHNSIPKSLKYVNF